MNTWKEHSCPTCGTINNLCWSDIERLFPKTIKCADCGYEFIRSFPLPPKQDFREYLENHAPDLLDKLESEHDLEEMKK